MPFKRTSMRYAHTNGHTSCTYTEKGDFIITCGSDGDIRIWRGIDDDDPTSMCFGEFILAAAQYDKRILISSDLNTVQAYTFPEGDGDGTEFRFTAPATCIKINKKFIAAGSDDTKIKVVKRDKSENEFELEGSTGPILQIGLCDKNDWLAASCGDGTIRIWDLNEKKEIKVISGLPKVKSFEAVKCYVSPSFIPKTGSYLVYGNGKEIIVLNTSTWEVHLTLTDNKITADYSYCSFSHCGQYISAGTTKGEISVWDFKRNEPIKGKTYNYETEGITSIVWNPKNNGEFAFCDSAGQLGTIIDCSNKNEDEDDLMIIAEAEENNQEESEFNGIQFRDDDDDNDADNDNCVSLERLKNETMRANGLLEDDDHVTQDSEPRSTRSISMERVITTQYTQQSAFQPGATPKNLEHRYLVWNNVGIVKAYSHDTDGSIDVEFHDVSVHHALHMNNYLNHTMGSLSTTVLALSGESSNKCVCIALGASGSREWSIEFPDCESAVAIVATSKLVAVATDNRYLRIFSIMGTQREVLSLPGPVVSMCGFEDKLMIAFHSAPASTDQYISAILLQIVGLTLRSRETRIPITSGKKLTWIGYSDRGSPCSCDTMGIVQMYSSKTNCWYPVCDTMKHTQNVSNNFYIIDVLESNQIIQAVLCRGTNYPMTNPRPMVTELPMRIPVAELETEKSQLEESLIRWSNFNVDNSEKMIKEAAIKLFALACRAEMETRAKELIEMIASPHLLPLAVKYATKLGRIHLADKLSELLPELEEKEKEREKSVQETEMEAFNILQNSPLNTSLLLMQKSKQLNLTPTIAPKPMVLNSARRNPFKKTTIATPEPNSNLTPLEQLEAKLVDLNNSVEESGNKSSEHEIISNNQKLSSTQDSEIIPCSINNENKPRNTNTSSKTNFMSWFEMNKEDLKIKHPNISQAELTKFAMREYKAITIESDPSKKRTGLNSKRKLDDGSNEKQSGIAKLAKFGFTKN